MPRLSYFGLWFLGIFGFAIHEKRLGFCHFEANRLLSVNEADLSLNL
jgi:hypothetical protein